jgi:hypothetical protein
MTDDIVSELGDLRRDASTLQGLIDAAQASAPRQAEASDASGAVWATIGPDGLPSAIWVQDDWARRLPGHRFGGAVVEAFSAAAQRRVAAWNEALSDNGWLSTVDNARADLDRQTTKPAPAPPLPVQRSPDGDAPRSLDAMLDDLLGALDNVDDLAARSTLAVEGTGTSGYHKLTLVLSHAGLVSCVVDEQWASQQSGAALVGAFDEALARAKADLTAKADADPDHRLDRVVGEALTLLNDPQRLIQS